mmetsp:Transcript_45860/g.53656  ORF Transcript_45860/g.53656 Transcript_45860/m.53656 type:complete len:83 (+) Transcript_45860:159-407(+)
MVVPILVSKYVSNNLYSDSLKLRILQRVFKRSNRIYSMISKLGKETLLVIQISHKKYGKTRKKCYKSILCCHDLLKKKNQQN